MSYDPSLVRGSAVVKRDGTNDLTGDWDIGNQRAISLEELQIRDASGLTISDTTANVLVSIDNQTGLFSLRHGSGVNEISNDTTLTENSDNVIPTQKAIKTYVNAVAGTSGTSGSSGTSGAVGTSGSSGSSGTSGTTAIAGAYIHTQSVASNVWTVEHNLGYQYVNLEIVNDSGESWTGRWDYPTVEFVNINQLTITFDSTSETGWVSVTSGGGQTGATAVGGAFTHVQSSDSTSWVITHMLDSQYVNVEVADSNDLVIIPDEISFDTTNQLTITFLTGESGHAAITSGGGTGTSGTSGTTGTSGSSGTAGSSGTSGTATIPSGTDHAVARYNGSNTIQDSGVILDDSDNIIGVNDLDITGHLNIDSDTSRIYFGEGQDANIFSNGTDLILNSPAGGKILTASDVHISTGNVGMGVAPASTAKLYIVSNISSGYAIRAFNDGNVSTRYGLRMSCGKDDGTESYNYMCYDGDHSLHGGVRILSSTVELYQASDERLKMNIIDMSTDALALVNGLPVREFNWRHTPDSTTTIGFIAQEMLLADHRLANTVPNDPTEFKGVTQERADEILADGPILTTSITSLIPYHHKAIQQLSTKEQELRQRIADLEQEVALLKGE